MNSEGKGTAGALPLDLLLPAPEKSPIWLGLARVFARVFWRRGSELA